MLIVFYFVGLITDSLSIDRLVNILLKLINCLPCPVFPFTELKERNEITGLLLQHGSSINNTNIFGMSPLSKIVERITNSKEAIEITSENTKVYVETDLSLFNQLVCGGADLTSSRYTPLSNYINR